MSKDIKSVSVVSDNKKSDWDGSVKKLLDTAYQAVPLQHSSYSRISDGSMSDYNLGGFACADVLKHLSRKSQGFLHVFSKKTLHFLDVGTGIGNVPFNVKVELEKSAVKVESLGITAYYPPPYRISLVSSFDEESKPEYNEIQFTFDQETKTLNYRLYSFEALINDKITATELPELSTLPNSLKGEHLKIIFIKILDILSKRPIAPGEKEKNHIPSFVPSFINIGDVHYIDENKFFQGKKFDLIVSRLAFTEFKHPALVLEKLYNFLNKDGYMIISNLDFYGIPAEEFINIIEKMKSQGYAMAWSPQLLHNAVLADNWVVGTLIIKKIDSKKSLRFPFAPSKIVVENKGTADQMTYLQYELTETISVSPLLKDKSSSSLEKERKVIQTLFGKCGKDNPSPADLSTFALEEDNIEEIMRSASRLPRFSKLFPESLLYGKEIDRNLVSVWNSTGDNLKNYLEIISIEYIEDFNKDLFIDTLLLAARMELDLYIFSPLYLADCKKLGLPPPSAILAPGLFSQNAILKSLTSAAGPAENKAALFGDVSKSRQKQQAATEKGEKQPPPPKVGEPSYFYV